LKFFLIASIIQVIATFRKHHKENKKRGTLGYSTPHLQGSFTCTNEAQLLNHYYAVNQKNEHNTKSEKINMLQHQIDTNQHQGNTSKNQAPSRKGLQPQNLPMHPNIKQRQLTFGNQKYQQKNCLKKQPRLKNLFNKTNRKKIFIASELFKTKF